MNFSCLFGVHVHGTLHYLDITAYYACTELEQSALHGALYRHGFTTDNDFANGVRTKLENWLAGVARGKVWPPKVPARPFEVGLHLLQRFLGSLRAHGMVRVVRVKFLHKDPAFYSLASSIRA